jgi:mannosyltransferase OCH1-like enzyme
MKNKIINRFTGYLKKQLKKKKLYRHIDDNVIDLLQMKYVLFYLKNKYFLTDIYNITPPILNQQIIENKVIWICWLQGYDNANNIVKACIKSVREHSNGYDVILITEKNINSYVRFPDYIIKKYKKGLITRTHFSDLLRVLLLVNYGGVWLDATVFLTDNIPEKILKSELFMFKTSILGYDFLPASSWFIAAKKNNPILKKLLNVLLSFWEKEEEMPHYYLFHIALLLLIKYDKESIELWEKILYKNNSEPHVLQSRLFYEFSDSLKDHIWQISFAHKLSHYFSSNREALLKKEGTFYQYILSTLNEND